MREHFKAYNEIWSRIRELSYKLEEIENNIFGIKGIPYGEHIPSTAPTNFNEKLMYRDELLSQMEELKTQKKALYDKHIEEISKVNDEREQSILRCYYLLKMSIEDISALLNLTGNRIYKLKHEAIRDFKRANNIE